MTDTPPEGSTTSPAETAAGRYESLANERLPFLRRAREAAQYTIPSLMPPEGHSGSTDLPQPYQSIGSRGVNNLAAKLLMALFPSNAPFFRLTMDDFVVEELSAQAGSGAEDARAEFEEALGKCERAVTNRMEQQGTRVIRHEAIVHLIVAGNGLIQVLENGAEKFHTLENYVAKRDLDGNLLEVIVRETLSRASLPERVKAFVSDQTTTDSGNPDEKTVELYTWVQRENDKWTVVQQVEGKDIPDTEGTYPLEKCPWRALRWRIVPGEDYGRGHCEENIGDLKSLESLRQSMVLITAAVAKVIFLRDPSAVTTAKRFAQAPSGAFLDGRESDVKVLQVEKNADFAVAKTLYDDIKGSLERAFLQTSSVQRDAERVTAEEIRAMIQELEASLGGIYSLLAEEFQRPLVVIHMGQMQRTGKLPQLPEKAVSPQIVTGLDGLGRNGELQRLNQLLVEMSQELGQEAVAEYVNVGSLLKRKASYLGIDSTGLIRTDEEVAQTRQQNQQQQMAEKLGPHMLNLVGKGAELGAANAPPSSPSQ